MSILSEYKERCDDPNSDIHEHLPILRDLALECDHVTEMGVRALVSTYAFMEGLKGRNGTLISIDLLLPRYFGGNIITAETLAKEEKVDWHFVLGDTLKIEIDETDLLFIDTLHTYEQLQGELKRHADKARKYLVFHDTTYYAEKGELFGKGLWEAIEEFLKGHSEWKIKERFTNNHGLTVLEHV